MAAVHAAERAAARAAPREPARHASTNPAAPAPSDHVLALQRRAGNQAVATAIVQRDSKAPPRPAPRPNTRSDKRTVRTVDPDEWIEWLAGVVQERNWDRGVGFVLTVASNTAYAFDTQGASRRHVGASVADTFPGESVWRVDVAHAVWEEAGTPGHILTSDVGWEPPLPDSDIKAVCEAMGFVYGGPRRVWLLLDVEPDVIFAPPQPAQHASEDTPAMRRRAQQVVDDLRAAWKKRRAPKRSALAGVPTFASRYNARTGWHIRITLDQVAVEVPLEPGDSAKDVQARVEQAVAGMRAKYEPAATPPPALPGGKHDPKANPPPAWYVPFEDHPALKEGHGAANAPTLPAAVLYKPDEADSHPSVMVGATYDFRMQIEWQFAGPFGSAEAMNAGYYWELLAATPADWSRLAGEPSTPVKAAPSAGPPPARAEDRRGGGGTRVTRWDDGSSDQRQERRKVGEDMAHDLEDDDTTGFVGEAVAGGYRILKTQVISTLGDILDHLDPSNRRVEFPAPGYYLVRCISAASTSGKDPDKDFIRSPSVAVIPVKAQLNYGVAKARAKDELARAAGRSAFARYTAELDSTRTTLEAARSLQSRLATDPALRAQLASDPVTAASRLTVPQLAVLALAEQRGASIDQLVADLAEQLKEATGTDHKDKIESWHKQLKPAPDDTTDYPVGATFIAQDTGQEIPLRLMIGQAHDSSDAAPHWLVFDITSERSRDHYEGRSGADGGHAAALREALRAFAGENPYSYGEIGLAWPGSFGKINLKAADLPVRVHSAPNADLRRKHRRTAYVDIATLLLPMAKAAKLRGLVRAAEAFIALLGAKNAVDSMRDRSRTGHLYEPGTLLELVQVMSAVRTVGDGVRFVVEGKKLVDAARRIGDQVELLTKLEGGLQIITIPFTVRDQLNAIDAMTGSAEHKAAMLAFVLGRAVHQGVVSVRAIRPGERTLFYDDSKDPHPDEPHEQHAPDQRRENEPDHAGGGGGAPPAGKPLHGPVPGMSAGTAKTLGEFCTNYGVVIDVRPTTASAAEWRGVGAVAKPEAIKAKTINEYDRLLGAPQGAIGLVGYFDPTPPTRPDGMSDADFGRLQGRYQERSAEFKRLATDMAALQHDGRVRIREGVVELLDPRKGGSHYAPVTGDHDLFDIQWADNREMSDAQADGLVAMLRTMNIGIEHPAHMRWRPTAAKDIDMYKDIIAQHRPGPAFKHNLIRFAPGESPREVPAGTPVSPTTPRGRPKWDVHVTEPHGPGGGRGGHGGGGGGAGGSGSAIPPPVHDVLQQFADVYQVAINVRRDARGGLRVDVEWAATLHAAAPRPMTDTERHAFTKMLTDMNIGVAPTHDPSTTGAPVVRVRPTRTPAQAPDIGVDEVPSRVGQPKYHEVAPPATDIPGRAGLTDVEQRALDRYVQRVRMQPRMTPQLESQLRAASPDELRRRLRQAMAEQPQVDADRQRAAQIQDTNAPDPRQARFDHDRDEGGGVTSRWNSKNRPSDRELAQAKDIAAATGDRVVIYGDSFGGVDGTIGAPPRLLQMKSAPDAAALVRVLNEAKQNAQRFGDRDLEVHIAAPDLTLAEATEALRKAPVPFGSWLARVTVHVRGGHFDVPPSGRP